jgi:hypothetical protein
MLTQEEKENILSEFPNIKLSYEKITHKKVYNCDLIFAIPEGKKCFVWFNSYNDKNLCFLFELDNKNKKEIKNIRIVNSCFSRSLCYGTIFYGTLFYHLNNPFFCIEDIFMYKGQDISRFNLANKINKICDILKKDIKQISYNNYFIVFGLPVISKTDLELGKNLETIKYKLSHIKYSNMDNSYSLLQIEEYFKKTNDIINKPVEHEIKIPKKPVEHEIKIPKKPEKQSINKLSKTFIVKPDIQNDIYHLYTLDNEYNGLACIPDYKTSAMMNKLFRNIKENNDLDALELSDDEEEFENPNVDKFVYLDKSYKMICNLNTKFKKWVPIKITD